MVYRCEHPGENVYIYIFCVETSQDQMNFFPLALMFSICQGQNSHIQVSAAGNIIKLAHVISNFHIQCLIRGKKKKTKHVMNYKIIIYTVVLDLNDTWAHRIKDISWIFCL